MRLWSAVLLAMTFMAAPAAAQETTVYRGETTVYRGETTLVADTVWSGEVLVDGILTVPPEVTLEIRPGTAVRFTRFDSNGDGIGEHELFIQGHLRVLGTGEAPVVFTSAEANPQPSDWGAINLMASTARENLLRHLKVDSAYRGFHAHFAWVRLEDCLFSGNQRGMQFQESTVSMERCRVVDNGNGVQFRNSEVTVVESLIARNYWGLRCVYSTVSLRGSRIEANLVNGVNLRDSTVEAVGNVVADNRKGLYLQRCEGKAKGNDLSGNSEHGILLEDSTCRVEGNRIGGNGRAGVKWIDSEGLLRGNDLVGNGEYALYNDGSGDVDAQENWWGTTDAAAISALVVDSDDRSGLGLVDASRPLEASPKSLKLEASHRATEYTEISR